MRSKARYLLVLISCCLMAASSVGVYTNSAGVFYTKVSSELGVGRGAFALHATLCALTTGFLCPLAARIIRRYPFRILLAAGSLLSALSTAAMSLARSVWAFYLLGVLRGVGMTVFYLMPVTTLINNWFQKKHGLAVGIALSFSGLAGAVFSPLFSSMIESAGWRASFTAMAAIGFALTVPGIAFAALEPKEAGLPAYGAQDGAPAAKQAAAAPAAAPSKKAFGPAIALLALMTLLHTSVTGIAQHFPGIAEWMGAASSVGAAMISAGMIGNIVSKLAIGALSDRIGPFRSSLVMIAANASAVAGLLLCGGRAVWALYGLAFLYGTVYSVGAVGISLLTRTLFGAENYASAYSLITVFMSIGSASALTLIGLVYDLTGGYAAAFVGALAIDAADIAILLFLMRMKKRQAARA